MIDEETDECCWCLHPTDQHGTDQTGCAQCGCSHDPDCWDSPLGDEKGDE